MYPYILQGDSITIVVDNTQHTITKASHPNFDKIRDAIREQNWSAIPDLIDMVRHIANYSQGYLEVRDGDVYWDGRPFHNSLTDRLLKLMEEGFPIEPLVNFMHNLKLNPSKRAVDELYGFLEKNSLPITPDGHFLAYKKVRNDFRDIHSGTMDNSVGRVVEMARNEVDEDKDRTCSSGLHFCSLEYLPHFGQSGGDRVVIVKINPADVVSIPSDYNNAKGRTCRYEVIAEHTVADGEDRDRTEAFNSVVYGEFDESESDWADDYGDDNDSDSYTSDGEVREVIKTYDRNGVKQYRFADNGFYASREAYETWKEYRDNNL